MTGGVDLNAFENRSVVNRLQNLTGHSGRSPRRGEKDMTYFGNRKGLDCAYLFEDGHLVKVFEETYKGVRVKTVEVIEKFCDRGPKGRLVFHSSGLGYLPCFKGAERVEAETPDIKHGSDRTRELGLRLAHVIWHRKDGTWGMSIMLPDVLSGEFSYQPENKETFEECLKMRNWSDYPIYKITEDAIQHEARQVSEELNKRVPQEVA